MILRPLTEDDKRGALQAHKELALDNFDFLLGYFGKYDENDDWSGFLKHLGEMHRGENVPEEWVPASFLVAEIDDQIIGRVSLRHSLNDFLELRGGHIGYGIRPAFRGRGYATEILQRSLHIVLDMGVERVLVTCDDTNIGSSRVIEKCGGVLENIIEVDDGVKLRRYWIDTPT